jgi:hypothetical protein
MRPSLPPVSPDPALDKEIATVLSHKKMLLRLKNWLRSSFLRLPKETLIHILSYIMDYEEHSTAWKPVYHTCHHIYNIMRTATELWWKVDCRWAWGADLVFTRAKGSPRVLIAELSAWNREARVMLDEWREKRALQGHRLRRLELFGYPTDFSRFQWMFEGALPCLNHLKIHFSPRPRLSNSENVTIPIDLQLPTDMPLRILDLRNTTLPWSSKLFAGLSQLRLDLKDCDPMHISEDELLRILEVSPQLESLSLIQVGPKIGADGDACQPAPGRILQFPRLTSLELDNSPTVVGYILAHIGIPAITSLKIRSPVSSLDLVRALDHLIPNHHIQNRLFSNPPIFEVGAADDGLSDFMILNIGAFKICFDFDFDDVVAIRDVIMARIQPLVPLSVTSLKLDFSESELEGLEWAEFLDSHPELRTIECLKDSSDPEAESLWEALSPSGTDNATVCQKLELIWLVGDPPPVLRDCLLNRKNAGFELERLKVEKPFKRAKVVEEFESLVGTLEIYKMDDKLAREVRTVSMTFNYCLSMKRLSNFLEG